MAAEVVVFPAGIDIGCTCLPLLCDTVKLSMHVLCRCSVYCESAFIKKDK